MRTWNDLEPGRVFFYFAEICKIPHGSHHLKEISNYLADFAASHHLAYLQDGAGNLIISKEASEGYGSEKGIILQGHIDMVAVHKPELQINMETDPVRPVIDGDVIRAEGTSLGGDDGIAVAYALAILEDDTILHPYLEVILTTDEEVGMDGARVIDLSSLKGSRMLNLDTEEEGHFLIGCAGGARVDHIFQADRVFTEGIAVLCKITGLTGGHSGTEIQKGRANSNVLTGRLLRVLQASIKPAVFALDGGLADNAIPRETQISFLVAEQEQEKTEQTIRKFEKMIQSEYQKRDPEIQIETIYQGVMQQECVDQKTLQKLTDALIAMPDGVQVMSAEIPGLVQTSLNNGVLKIDEKRCFFVTSIRSSVKSQKEALIEKAVTITRLAGGITKIRGDYPGWEYRQNSPFRELCLKIYREMYKKEPIVEAIHAGVECGILIEKRSELDCVSIGPDMESIHTTEEKLSIASVQRVWEYILRVLSAKEE